MHPPAPVHAPVDAACSAFSQVTGAATCAEARAEARAAAPTSPALLRRGSEAKKTAAAKRATTSDCYVQVIG